MQAVPAFLDTGTEMGRRIATHDWASTPLGAIETWPPSLKIAVALVLRSGFAKCLCWGDSHIAIYNEAFSEILAEKGDCLGLPFSLIWQEAWDTIGPIAAKALAGEATFIKDFPLTVRRRATGAEEAFFTFSYSPVVDETGTVQGFMDTVMETTDRVRFERRAAISNRELVHRMKNSYALISAIVRQIARKSESVNELREKLLERLMDMASAQEMLSLRSNQQATVEEVVAHATSRVDEMGNRFDTQGPEVELTDPQTFALTLALFELATNSVKYGALGSEEGRISVIWRIEAGRLDFVWQETGGPAVSPPRRKGFGSFLVRQLLAAEFQGDVSLDFAPGGLQCRLTAPAPAPMN